MEFEVAALTDRLDWKYVFRIEELADVLENVANDYYILEINKLRHFRYDNHYFDSEDLKLFYDHHTGRTNRFKVRTRSYLDSDLSFLELKKKTNKLRTIKSRIRIDSKDLKTIITDDFVKESMEEKFIPGLTHSLQVKYTRISLLSKDLKERVTIDTDLEFINHVGDIICHNMVIAEVKRKRKAYSPFIIEMKRKFMHPLSISKYCYGITRLHPEVKANRFKPSYSRINKIIA